MHPAVAALPFAEKGLILGALLARMAPQRFATRFGGPAGARGRTALEALAEQSRSARAATLAELITLVRAPVPAGMERIHPGWLRERLAPESSAVIRAVADGLPAEVRRVAEQLLTDRGESTTGAGASATGAGPAATGVAELRRQVFGGLVPLGDPGGPTGQTAAPLMALPLGAVAEAIEVRGAETLGASLRGAPRPVVARAAASVGDRLAHALLDAAARPGPTEERDGARRLVEKVAVEQAAHLAAPDLAAQLGARALAIALAPEGRDAALAVAQRLPPELGRRLLAFVDLAVADLAVAEEVAG